MLTEDAPDAAAPGSEADAAATEPDERPTPGDDVVPPPEVPGRTYYVEIFLIGLASLLLEIAYTRVISFKLFYYYTYLVIGLALLGIGSGAVFVSGGAERPRANRRSSASMAMAAATTKPGSKLTR